MTRLSIGPAFAVLALLNCGIATPAAAAPKSGPRPRDARVISYGPAPVWVIAPPAASAAPSPPGAPLRVIYADQQTRLGADGEEAYLAQRFKILSPDALQIGNVTIAWSPSSERITIHRLSIIRDGRTIDVLATQKFAVIQRESNLEQAMLDGNLTATLQAAGLQVGDELDFAMTKIRRDLNLGDRPQGFMQFPVIGQRGSFRLRVIQPKSLRVAFRSAPDVPVPSIVERETEREQRYELVDPASVVVPEGAPPRYMIRRLVQYSTYTDWADLSRQLYAIFATAGSLAAASPVRAEAARIAALTTDPVRRAEAALQATQDRIRYVYVGLDGGNYRPAAVDQTWQRRFGDCKAKTVLLVALLRELGIAAEAVLVNTQGGDGTDGQLPSPAMFDHVIVRATIDGRRYWLDGTRMGDRRLATLDPPTSRWALPLTATGVALEPVTSTPPARPQFVQAMEIDASAGIDKPAKVIVEHTIRGPEIVAMRAQLAGLAAADADRAQAGYWRQLLSWVEPSRTTWRFDDDAQLIVLRIEGEGKPEWEGDPGSERTLDIAGAGFTPPSEMKRPKDQDQAAAWATDYPRFRCWATTIRLPADRAGYHWDYQAKPVDRVLGGVAYWRIAALNGNVMRTVMSRRVLMPEITAEEAASVNSAIKGFDNKISRILETNGARSSTLISAASMVENKDSFGTFADFSSAAPPCQSPAAPK